MTITKEQVAQWAHAASQEVVDHDLGGNPITEADVALMGALGPLIHRTTQLAFTAGAEAKLAELLAGVEMPEPELPAGNMPVDWDIGYFTLTQLQDYAAAAVAKEDTVVASLSDNVVWQAAKIVEHLRVIDLLTAERDAIKIGHESSRTSMLEAIAKLKAIAAENTALTAELDRYKKHGVTCQTYGHVVGACAECNTHAEIDAEVKADALESQQHFSAKYFELLPLYEALTAQRDSLREQVRREQLYVQDAHDKNKALTAERDALAAKVEVLREALEGVMYWDNGKSEWGTARGTLEATK